MIISHSDLPIANPVCVLREEFDDWAVLFNPDTADAVGINPVGVAVWKLMDGRRDLRRRSWPRSGKHFAEVPDTVARGDRRVRRDLAAARLRRLRVGRMKDEG